MAAKIVKNSSICVMQDTSFDNKFKLSDYPVKSYMEEIISQLSKSLILKKEQIIKDKFEQKGLSHLLQHKSIPNRVVKEIQGEKEMWYAYNGTDEGILVVTFYQAKTEMADGKIKATIKYI